MQSVQSDDDDTTPQFTVTFFYLHVEEPFDQLDQSAVVCSPRVL